MSTMSASYVARPKPSFPQAFSGNPSLINRTGSKAGKADQAWIPACAGMTNWNLR
ncbi:hypothetical protein [Undibacterium sp. YM2]|uniref:hypothetical protein n=1 Tax=Undibacterium sp. YM2 TaxID=2058625 RepID=UPI00138979E0|nr:hypothetical protein [Undibacterium sp. YM2]